MLTVYDALRGISAYPIHRSAVAGIARGRRLSLDDEATAELMSSTGYRLAVADVLRWLSEAPDVSQGGQSYSFTDSQRTDMKLRADKIYSELAAGSPSSIYGYKGSRL